MNVSNRLTKCAAPALILALSLAVAGVGLAGGPMGDRRGPGHGPGHRGGPPDIDQVLERHAERLGLSDETSAKISTISEAARGERRTMEEELHALHEQMREMLDQDAPDRSAVMAKADAIGDLKTEIRKNQLGAMLDVRALLTPEQRAELGKIHAERREDRREMRRERRMNGPAKSGPPPRGRMGMDDDF